MRRNRGWNKRKKSKERTTVGNKYPLDTLGHRVTLTVLAFDHPPVLLILAAWPYKEVAVHFRLVGPVRVPSVGPCKRIGSTLAKANVQVCLLFLHPMFGWPVCVCVTRQLRLGTL